MRYSLGRCAPDGLVIYCGNIPNGRDITNTYKPCSHLLPDSFYLIAYCIKCDFCGWKFSCHKCRPRKQGNVAPHGNIVCTSSLGSLYIRNPTFHQSRWHCWVYPIYGHCVWHIYIIYHIAELLQQRHGRNTTIGDTSTCEYIPPSIHYFFYSVATPISLHWSHNPPVGMCTFHAYNYSY